MDIEDILEDKFPGVDFGLKDEVLLERNPEAAEFLRDEMWRIGGDELAKKAISVCGMDEGLALTWFYSKIADLGGIRPYDACNENKRDEVGSLLEAIDHNVYR